MIHLVKRQIYTYIIVLSLKKKNGFILHLWPRVCSDRQHSLRWLPVDVCWTPWWNTTLQINKNNKCGCKKGDTFAERSVFMETSNFATAVTLSLGVLLHELHYHRQQTPTNFPLPPQWMQTLRSPSPTPTPHSPMRTQGCPSLLKYSQVCLAFVRNSVFLVHSTVFPPVLFQHKMGFSAVN